MLSSHRVRFLIVGAYALGPAELVRNKRASGRPKDIADLALLDEIED